MAIRSTLTKRGQAGAARSSVLGAGANLTVVRGKILAKFAVYYLSMEPLTGRRNFIEICGSGSKFADRNLRCKKTKSLARPSLSPPPLRR